MTGRFLRDAICVARARAIRSIVPKGRIVLVEILRSNICKTGVYRSESLSSISTRASCDKHFAIIILRDKTFLTVSVGKSDSWFLDLIVQWYRWTISFLLALSGRTKHETSSSVSFFGAIWRSCGSRFLLSSTVNFDGSDLDNDDSLLKARSEISSLCTIAVRRSGHAQV